MKRTFEELVVEDKVPTYGYGEEYLPGGEDYEEQHMKDITFVYEEEGSKAIHNEWDSEYYNNCNYLILKEGKPIAIISEYECEDLAIQKGNMITLPGHDAISFFDIETGEYSRNYIR
jgi:hypothetical protein